MKGCFYLGTVKRVFDSVLVKAGARTLYYLFILILLVLIYGFHDMSAGPFIYAEF
ncbi:teichoic acid D-Ala incorporation-associated protein DltX [Heyndrickxia sp. NPDC080065]|uniref:teichoic acid D-Ala incorporation-associated protein DltX n=1 Tax=Heyndrickxia sp. NPDC080065 TaxID=3390568 RepID=UPI003D07A0A5